MRSVFNFGLGLLALGLSLAVLLPTGAEGDSSNSMTPNRGLAADARQELEDAGVNKYLGLFEPADSEPVTAADGRRTGWVKHTFDNDGTGPICIAGTPYTAFTSAGNPANVLIFLQGGGACWQDFYFCSILADDDPPTAPVGIWDFGSKDNPFRDYSIVYLSYCDGCTFGGDNDVVDANFPFGPVRFHRGLRNVSAGMDLAKAMFPHASSVVVAGSSAGGVGAAAFAPFLARFLYGNNVDLTVFNDAGPIAINLNEVAAIQATTSPRLASAVGS